MSKLTQYIGIMAVLLGVVILGLYHFKVMTGNSTLMFAAIIMILGVIGHIILNRVR